MPFLQFLQYLKVLQFLQVLQVFQFLQIWQLLTIFDHFHIFWVVCDNFKLFTISFLTIGWTFLGNFVKINFFYLFSKKNTYFQFFFTYFGNLANFWHCWQFWKYQPFLTHWPILGNFTIIYYFEIFWHFGIKTLTSTITILETYDIWDTDYNSYNWEPDFMTIFVTWQLRVTLDSNVFDKILVVERIKAKHSYL